MTFAPDYATSGRLYTYSTDAGGDIRVDLWQRSSDPDVALPGRTLVLRIEHSSRNNHNGGDLHFGPDGSSTSRPGDGGGADDPDDNGQTLIRAGTADEQSTALLGKLLRIAPGAAGGYTIPPDNPFVGTHRRPRRDLRLRPAQPVSLLVRPRERRPADRRRRPGRRGGGQLLRDRAAAARTSAGSASRAARRTTGRRRRAPRPATSRRSSSTTARAASRSPAATSSATPACRACSGATSTRTTASARSARSCRARAPATRRPASTSRTSRSRRSARTPAGGSTSCSSRARSRGLIDGAASPCPRADPAAAAAVASHRRRRSRSDLDGDGVPSPADRCPQAAHRTLDGCAAFVSLRGHVAAAQRAHGPGVGPADHDERRRPHDRHRPASCARPPARRPAARLPP